MKTLNHPIEQASGGVAVQSNPIQMGNSPLTPTGGNTIGEFPGSSLPGSSSSSSSSVSPVGGMLYAVATAPAGGNGSISAPFNTFAAGVAAAAGGVLLVLGSFAAEPTVLMPAAGISIRSLGVAPADTVLPDLDWAASASAINVQGVTVELVGSAARPFFLRGCATTSTNAASAATVVVEAGSFAGDFLSLSATNAVLGAITGRGASSLVTRVCRPSGVVTWTTIALTWDDTTLRACALAPVTILGVTSVVDLDTAADCYGLGTDGPLIIAAGTTVVGVAQYTNVTPTGTAAVETREGIFRCRGILDLSAAPVEAVRGRNITGGSGQGGNAAGSTAGNAGAAQSGRPWVNPGCKPGTAGGAGATTAGTAAIVPPVIPFAIGAGGGGTGASGAGGGGGGKAGVAAQTAGVTNEARVGGLQTPLLCWAGSETASVTAVNTYTAQGGRGGSSGGGDGVSKAGGGGGGGSTTHVGTIYAKYIKVSAATPARVFDWRSASGGNGGNSEGTDAAGGSGGGGGGGPGVQLVYDYLFGTLPVATDLIYASGGAGGAGGNGTGAGGGGAGGEGGAGGQIAVFNRGRVQRALTVGVAGAAGSPAVGTAGGAGGAGGVCTANLI